MGWPFCHLYPILGHSLVVKTGDLGTPLPNPRNAASGGGILVVPGWIMRGVCGGWLLESSG